jgi:hypothetical protein
MPQTVALVDEVRDDRDLIDPGKKQTVLSVLQGFVLAPRRKVNRLEWIAAKSIRFASNSVYFADKAMAVKSFTEGSDMYRSPLGAWKRDPLVCADVAEAFH